MKKGAGKAKGNQFERDVCKTLSLWVSGGTKIDLFWRSAMSGGRATVAKGAVRQAGDICAVAPEGNAFTNCWYIECKFYKDLAMAGFVFNQKGMLFNFWRATCLHSAKHNRQPMLIAKQNGWAPLLVVPANTLAAWVDNVGLLRVVTVPTAHGAVDVYDFREVMGRTFTQLDPPETSADWFKKAKWAGR